mmetsp:Transcript_30003/g.58865  ORF Transcript_30003/g.58865 Transcript_30003/m.58865 type:complete len:224 (+) Transcript_30003:1223-1894(+)
MTVCASFNCCDKMSGGREQARKTCGKMPSSATFSLLLSFLFSSCLVLLPPHSFHSVCRSCASVCTVVSVDMRLDQVDSGGIQSGELNEGERREEKRHSPRKRPFSFPSSQRRGENVHRPLLLPPLPPFLCLRILRRDPSSVYLSAVCLRKRHRFPPSSLLTLLSERGGSGCCAHLTARSVCTSACLCACMHMRPSLLLLHFLLSFSTRVCKRLLFLCAPCDCD